MSGYLKRPHNVERVLSYPLFPKLRYHFQTCSFLLSFHPFTLISYLSCLPTLIDIQVRYHHSFTQGERGKDMMGWWDRCVSRPALISFLQITRGGVRGVVSVFHSLSMLVCLFRRLHHVIKTRYHIYVVWPEWDEEWRWTHSSKGCYVTLYNRRNTLHDQ